MAARLITDPDITIKYDSKFGNKDENIPNIKAPAITYRTILICCVSLWLTTTKSSFLVIKYQIIPPTITTPKKTNSNTVNKVSLVIRDLNM